MINLFSAIIFRFSKSLPKQPPHIQLLRKKITKQNQTNAKLDFLQELKKERRLQQYFSSKTILDLSLEDVYFYLTNKEMFSRSNNMMLLAMINNSAMDTYSCFAVVHDSPFIGEPEFQIKLIQNFNQESSKISPQQLIYCLKLLKKFNSQIIQKYLKLKALKDKIQGLQQQFNLSYLEVLFELSELTNIKQLIDYQKSKSYVSKMGTQIIKHNPHIKYFYFLSVIEPLMGIECSSATEVQRQRQIQKKIILAKSDQQYQYIIKILNKHTQLIYTLKVQRMSPEVYIQYLQFLQHHKENDPNFFLIAHQIPANVGQNAKSIQLIKILQLRVSLKLDEVKNLGKLVKKIISKDLEGVLGLIRFLNQFQIQQSLVWADFEEGFISKLQLNSKKRDVVKIAKQQDMPKLFLIFAYMSKNKLGSTKFWKHTHFFIHDFLKNQNLVKRISAQDQNSFVISCFQIYGIHTIPKHIQKKLIGLALVALTNNFWDINDLFRFTKCLANNKFGEDEVWYGIQNKILQLPVSKKASQNMKTKFGWIVQYFKQMNLGSYKFMTKMSKYQESGIFIKAQRKQKQHSKPINSQIQQITKDFEIGEQKKSKILS